MWGLPADKYKSGFGYPPYMKWKSNQLMDQFLGPISDAIFTIKKVEQRSWLKNRVQGLYAPYLVVELWKITKLSCSPMASQMLFQLLEKEEWLGKELEMISPQVAQVVTSKESAKEISTKKEEMRAKLLQKREKVKEKMNKNT